MAEMDDFRWLTVGPVGQEDVSITLMAIPGPPVLDGETGKQVRDLVAKGLAGTVFLTTDDCQASYEELKGRSVDFTETLRSGHTGSTRPSGTHPATASA